jgi:hypothetical protein
LLSSPLELKAQQAPRVLLVRQVRQVLQAQLVLRAQLAQLAQQELTAQ